MKNSKKVDFFLLLIVAVLATFLLWGVGRWTHAWPGLIASIAIGYVVWESFVNLLIVGVTVREVSRSNVRSRIAERMKVRGSFKEAQPLSLRVSVLIAAYNEASCILSTIDSVLGQSHLADEIIVASDGSVDAMEALLMEKFKMEVTEESLRYESLLPGSTRLILLRLPRRGKGWALNSGLSAAHGEVVVTLDADTRLEETALEELSRPFLNDRMVAAGGFIFVRNARIGHWITRRQYVEYLKNFLCRIGLAHARVCLQVSGAFGAFRRDLLIEVGGFCPNSLVEDYEIIYRLHRHLLERKRDYRIGMVPRARAHTDGPETVGAFIQQRTRWFAGFLQTLWDYRFMIFQKRYGRIGLVMLPIKVLDALIPLWGLGSLGLLLVFAFSGNPHWSNVALETFAIKWLVDLMISSVLISRMGSLSPRPRLLLGWGRIAYCLITEGLVFQWFRQLAVLNAYSWMVRRVRRWDQPRWG